MCDLAWVRIFFPQTSGDRFKGVTPRANGHNIVGQQCLELLRPFPRSLRKPMKDCLFSVRIFYFSLGISLQEFFFPRNRSAGYFFPSSWNFLLKEIILGWYFENTT